MRHHNGSKPLLPSSRGNPQQHQKQTVGTTTWIIFLVFSSCISFYVGVWVAWSIQPPGGDSAAVGSVKNDASSDELCLSAINGGGGELGKRVGDALQLKIDRGEWK
jgi:hypothetical protein